MFSDAAKAGFGVAFQTVRFTGRDFYITPPQFHLSPGKDSGD